MRDASELRAALRGAPMVGIWANVPSPLTAEAAAAAGADYVVVDQQHGAVDPTAMLAMLQAIALGGAAPLVRVSANDPWVIGNALDLGALGVIVPMVESAAEAAAAVAASRYAPAGRRSIGVVRGASPGAEPADPVCLVMVETRAGLEAVEGIAATDGLDGIYIGPSDLSLSLGLTPTRLLEHPPVLDAIDRVREVCAASGRLCGLHCLAAEDVPRHAPAGFSMLTLGADLQYLRDALAAAVATARGA
ncbi:MAG TPA: aldolase/citrate lyase family protein [Solirubrobacteraceae bacterium]|nr:aldolase/citrate lyase family protein [Solirubrobacteraceae bacterium]